MEVVASCGDNLFGLVLGQDDIDVLKVCILLCSAHNETVPRCGIEVDVAQRCVFARNKRECAAVVVIVLDSVEVADFHTQVVRRR